MVVLSTDPQFRSVIIKKYQQNEFNLWFGEPKHE